MLRHSLVTPSRKEGPPIIWDTWFFGKRLGKSTCIFISTLSTGIASTEIIDRRVAPFVHCGEKWKARTRSRSEIPVSTWDFGSSLWQVPYTSHVSLQKDKIQDRGMYLFTISYGSYAMDQRSGDCLFSGWSSSSIRGISKLNFEVLDASFASALNKIIHNSYFKRRISLEERKAQKQDRFPHGRQINYLIYDRFWDNGSHDSVENFTDLFTIVLRNDDIQEYSTLSGTEFCCLWRKFHLMTSSKDCTIEEYESLRNWDLIGIVWPGDPEEFRTWLSQIENFGEKKFRARNSK